MSEGHVYVLTNVGMPGLVKIGLTRQDDVHTRVKGLSNTSVPFPFEVFYSAWVADCRKLERVLHFVFGERRVVGKEFFRIEPELAKTIIELVEIRREAPPSDAEQDISPAEREMIETVKKVRAEGFTFDKLGLVPGTVLAFVKDPEITCVVSGAKTVTFRDQEMSLSTAALKIIHEMGYDWATVRGPAYWTKDGVKLATLAAGLAEEASL